MVNNGNSKFDRTSGFNNYILRLKEKAPTFEYVSGYENDNSKVRLRCKNCGDVIERWATSVRANSNYRCFNCEKLETKRKNQEKRKAKEEEKQKRILQRQLDNSIQLSFFVCQHCGNLFVPTGNRTKYCSDRCRERHHEQIKSRKRIERASQNGKVDYSITLDKLIKKDNNKCYLCGGECNLNDFIMQGNQKVTGNYYPSIDHVIPLANGGTHSWNNVRLAHRICNSMKSNKKFF